MNILLMPDSVVIRNANSQPCDTLRGPCLCGAWHNPQEIADRLARMGIRTTAAELIMAAELLTRQPPAPSQEAARYLKSICPVRVVMDDSGDEFTGWPSIVGNRGSDTTLIHREGFCQQFRGLSQKQAIDLAHEIVRLINETHS